MLMISVFAVFTYFFGFGRFFGFEPFCRGMKALRTENNSTLS